MFVLMVLTTFLFVVSTSFAHETIDALQCPENATTDYGLMNGKPFCKCHDGMAMNGSDCVPDPKWCYGPDDCPHKKICCSRYRSRVNMFKNRCSSRRFCFGHKGCFGAGFEVPFTGCPDNATEIMRGVPPRSSCKCDSGFKWNVVRTFCYVDPDCPNPESDEISCCGTCMKSIDLPDGCPMTNADCPSST